MNGICEVVPNWRIAHVKSNIRTWKAWKAERTLHVNPKAINIPVKLDSREPINLASEIYYLIQSTPESVIIIGQIVSIKMVRDTT